MEIDGVVGILERMPGEQEHNSLGGSYLALSAQFLQAGQSYCRGGFAAQAFSAQLRLGDGDFCFTPQGSCS